jgi:peptidoglycan/xylan/chitin deacetylase (PgdA/CDA1 family)
MPSSPGRIPILMYHSLDGSGSVVSVTPAAFADQMRRLADRGIRGIALREAVAFHRAQGTWPADCAVLRFDDGYANFCEAAVPALTRHGFSATIFVVSGHLGGSNDWAPPPAGLGIQRMLSAQQMRELAAAGIEIGAHTRSHPDLPRLAAQEAEDEIAGSRADLEDLLGRPVEAFAYPFGNLSAAAVGIARREFAAACTTVLQRAGNDALHELPRIDMHYMRSRRLLDRLLQGRLDTYLAVRRWARTVRRAVGRWRAS